MWIEDHQDAAGPEELSYSRCNQDLQDQALPALEPGDDHSSEIKAVNEASGYSERFVKYNYSIPKFQDVLK